MLSARPKKWYSWDFTLQDAEGRHVADLDLSSWRERGRVVLGESEYRVRRLRVRPGRRRSCARGPARPAFGCEFEIEFEGDHYTLRSRRLEPHRSCCAGSRGLGTIRRAAWYKRGAHVELSERLSPVLTAFALWLALLVWKRDAGAAAAGA